MLKFFCLCLSIATFIGFILLVGASHYIETIIALILALGVGLWAYFKLKRKN